MTDTPDIFDGGGGRVPGEDSALAAEYVLHLMDPVTRAEFEQRLLSSPDLRVEVALWEAHFADMAKAELAPVAPPPALRKRLMDEVFPKPEAPSFWRSAGLWQALTFASLAVAAGLGWQSYQAPTGPAPLLVGEIAAEDESELRLLVVYDGVDGRLRLNRTDGVAAPGRALELWAIAGEEPPVSLGLLSDTAEGTVTLPPALRDRAGEIVLAISDEPPGGSPTGAPTGEVLALGQLTDLSHTPAFVENPTGFGAAR